MSDVPSVAELAQECRRAHERISRFIRATPLVRFADERRCEVWAKAENLQLTGSFNCGVP